MVSLPSRQNDEEIMGHPPEAPSAWRWDMGLPPEYKYLYYYYYYSRGPAAWWEQLGMMVTLDVDVVDDDVSGLGFIIIAYLGFLLFSLVVKDLADLLHLLIFVE